MKILSSIKRVLIHFRTSVKVISVLFIAGLIITGIVATIYHPIYAVYLNGEVIGYSESKANLQTKINEYMDSGEEQAEFVDIEQLPQYKLCLLKRSVTTNDDEVFEAVKDTGTNYYTYYAIVENGEEKAYIKSLEDAQSVLNQLKEKNSENKDAVSIEQKYETDLKDFVSSEQAVSSLYKEVKKSTKVASVTSRSSENISTSTAISNAAPSLGVSLIQPTTGKITSRYGERSSVRSSAHTGLDIANSTGTPIKAAAGGTVVFSGTKGSYGKMVIISHGNGVQTYYGHCSSLLVSVGQTVSQGEVIAKMGSTGNSTGSHLHLEVRVNGASVNPQKYVY